MTHEQAKHSPARRVARLIVWTTFAAVLFLRFVVMKHPAPPPGPPPGPGPGPGPNIRWRADGQQRFWRPNTYLPKPVAEIPKDLPRIQIEVPPEAAETLRGYYWNGWRGQRNVRPEALVTVREQGQVYTNVAMHLKGAAGSFRPFDDKPAITLNFSKHGVKQRFHGHSKISLNNSVQDPTFLSEALCRELFNAAGVPAPNADFATVVLNGRDVGLYVMLEGYTKDFLREHFKNVKGNLYDGGFCQEISPRLAVNSGEHPEDHSDIVRLISAATEPSTNRWESLAAVLDTERFMTFVAMDVITCNWDGYTMNKNNYRLYHDLDTDRMVFMPHGLDQMFGWPPHRFATDGPIQPSPIKGLISRAALSTPEGAQLYRSRLQWLRTNIFQEERVISRVHELDQRIRPTLAAYSPGLAASHDGLVADLCDRIQQRLRHVDEELNQPRSSVAFDDSGAAPVRNWTHPYLAPGSELRLDQVEKDGLSLLHISATRGGGTGSWRAPVRLEPGRYRLTGRCTSSPGTVGHVVLRSSGSNSRAQAIVGTDWVPLSYSFRVDEFNAEVLLVCEFSGAQGEVWFDIDSFRLVRQ